MRFSNFYKETEVLIEDNEFLINLSLFLESEENSNFFDNLLDKILPINIIKGVIEQLFYLTSGQWDKLSQENKDKITNNKEAMTVISTFVLDQLNALKISISVDAAFVLIRIIINIISKKPIMYNIELKDLTKVVKGFASSALASSIIKTALYAVSKNQDNKAMSQQHELGSIFNLRGKLFKYAKNITTFPNKVIKIKNIISAKIDDFKNSKVEVGFSQEYKDKLDKARNEIKFLTNENITTTTIGGSDASFQSKLPIYKKSTKLCPICNGKITGTCRCKIGNKTCENNHSFYFKDNKVFEGSGHDSDGKYLMDCE